MQVSNNKNTPSRMKKPSRIANNLEVSKQTATSNPPSERTKNINEIKTRLF